MSHYVAPIVEGGTEESCIKKLLSRVWSELLGASAGLCVLEPHRVPRGSILKSSDPSLNETVEAAHRKLRQRMRGHGDCGFVLLLVDAEEDCPKTVSADLISRSRIARPDADVACVLPNRQLENWFKAAATSLAGTSGLPADLETPPDPEEGSGDTWLSKQMKRIDPRRKYKKPADALEFVLKMNLQQCRDNSRSFDKLCRELEKRII